MGFQEWISKDMCLEVIGLHAQNMITILGSIVNRIGWDLYDHSMSTRIVTSILNIIFIGALKINRKVAMTLIWIC